MATAIGDLVATLGVNNRPWMRGLGQAQGRMATFGARTIGIFRNLAAAFVPISGAALFAGVLRSGELFNQKMLQSLAIMGDVSDKMQGDMKSAAFKVAAATRYAASDAAESYYFLASAGLDAKQSIAALPQVAKFAQAGNFNMARATDLATDAQSALGLTVKDANENLKNLTRVTDVLTMANTLANASTEQFSEALTTKTGAALRMVGKDIEEGVAVLAAFADQGVKSSEAGTQMSIVMRDLQTKAIKNKEAFAYYGMSVFDANGEMRNMADIIENLEVVLGGMSDETKKATLLQMGFSDKSLAATMTLIGMSDRIREYERNLRQAGGTTQKVADDQLTDLQEGWAKASAAATEAGAAMMEAIGPDLNAALTKAAEGIGLLAQGWNLWKRSLEGAREKFVLPGLIEWYSFQDDVDRFFGFEGVNNEFIKEMERVLQKMREIKPVAEEAAEAVEKIPGHIVPAPRVPNRWEIKPTAPPSEEVTKIMDQINRDLLTRGMNGLEVKLFDLENLGASKNILDELRATIEAIKQDDAAKKLAKDQAAYFDDLKRKGNSLKRNMMTPLEEYHQKIQDFRQLLDVGAIGPEMAYRAAEAATDDYYAKTKPKDDKQEEKKELPGMLMRGSAEAWKKIVSSMYGKDKNKAADQTAANTQRTADALDRIENRPVEEVAI